MTKIIVPVLTEKDVNILIDTLSKAAPHMTPAKKREATMTLGKIARAKKSGVVV